MNEPNKPNQSNEETSQINEGSAAVTPTSGWKKLFAKKWVFPAAYMAVAAIILTLMWVYQDSANHTVSESELGLEVTGPVENDPSTAEGQQPDALAVNANAETMQWPVADRDAVDVIMHFFDSKASNEARQAAMVEYGDTFTPHMGIDLARQDGQTFDVTAALSGQVTRIENHPVVGYQLEITHPNGLITVYQSLSDVTVQQGAEVKKGDIIAKAGRNELEKDMGTHVHFEIRQQDGAALNPETFLMQGM